MSSSLSGSPRATAVWMWDGGVKRCGGGRQANRKGRRKDGDGRESLVGTGIDAGRPGDAERKRNDNITDVYRSLDLLGLGFDNH